MKSPFRLPPSAFCVALAAFVIQHSAFGIAAEPPPAAAQGGVQLWEDGPRWADRNVGAEEPWEAGLYFWWGDAVGCRRENGKWAASDGSTNDCRFVYGNEAPYRQSASGLMERGWTTTNNVLAPAHDAARAHWGGEWRMPTKQELEDLAYNKCDWTFLETNGVAGFVVRGRGDYASAAIFLPAAGHGLGIVRRGHGSSGCLWASEPYADGRPADCTWRLRFGSREIGTNFCWDRYIATPVRPVRDE